MTATPSTMLAIGTAMPSFRLPDFTGRLVSSSAFANTRGDAGGLPVPALPLCAPRARRVRQLRARVRCPGPRHRRHQLERRRRLSSRTIRRQWSRSGMRRATGFPYLYDETQEVAKAYRAACTPDFFLFDNNRKLVYRGQFDDSRPDNGIPGDRPRLCKPPTACSRRQAEGQQRPSIGCNIKWKPATSPTTSAAGSGRL